MPPLWKKKRIGELASVSRGASPRPIASPRWFDATSKVRWVRIADLNRSDGRTLTETTQALSGDGIARSRYLEPGTLIMSIAATVGVPVITAIPTCIHDGFVSFEDLKADKRFLLYLLKASETRLRGAGQSGSQTNINSDIVRGLEVWLPSKLQEQARIASTLWDVDDLLSLLETMIAKKRAVKQGMMQELLTGRTRLPGFEGEWKRTSFGDVVRIERGSTLTRAQAGDGIVPIVAGGKTPAGFTNRPNRAGRTITISASGAYAGFVSMHEAPIFASDCSTISSSGSYDLDFVYFSLVLKQDAVYRAQTGGAQSHVHARDVYPISFAVPPTIEEQQAIAKVLRDADAEIAALERRLETTRAIKQGMMQELLTGRTRLPVKEDAA